MFFLGAGFLLAETRAVVALGLVFGNTWVTASVVFAGVLGAILLANALVLTLRIQRTTPAYIALFTSLVIDYGLDPANPVVALTLVLLPVACASLIFAVSFQSERDPRVALGANIAGALLGGLSEYLSLLLGFQGLLLVLMLWFGLSVRDRR